DGYRGCSGRYGNHFVHVRPAVILRIVGNKSETGVGRYARAVDIADGRSGGQGGIDLSRQDILLTGEYRNSLSSAYDRCCIADYLEAFGAVVENSRINACPGSRAAFRRGRPAARCIFEVRIEEKIRI